MATMEDLTKTQIVLLTLLISFVTSIATGIITTSLLAEAPAGVTQTINRVVERTIEKVVPSATSTGVTTVREVTVVSEDEAITGAIDKASKSIVRLNYQSSDGTQNFYALGMIVTKDGQVISDGNGLVLDATYSATLPDGTVVPAFVVSQTPTNGLIVFKLNSAAPKTYPFLPIAANKSKLGQTVIVFEGKDAPSVAVGRITGLSDSAINTDIISGETQGSPLINLSGELVGVKSRQADLSISPGVYSTLTQISKNFQGQ